ncbi:MAG: rplJ [Ignavibacteria bacterium]|nr:rplJ [Ignavibacteria bacterium]
MITKSKKEETVKELVELLEGVSGLYIFDFNKLNVADTINLRRLMKEKKIKVRVAKNTLILLALKEFGKFEVPEKYFFGQSALAFSYDDPTVPARILKQFTEKRETPKLKAAVIEGQVYDGSRLKELAELPSKEDLIASILGSINAPISGIVGSINAVLRDVAYLVEEVAKTKAA